MLNPVPASTAEKQELPVELVRAVLSHLTPDPPGDEDDPVDGPVWDAFLSLRISSSQLKEEVEALQPWALKALAEKGAQRLLLACCRDEADPQAIRHSALLDELKAFTIRRRSDGEGMPSATAVRKVLALAPRLEELEVAYPLASDTFVNDLQIGPELYPSLKRLTVGGDLTHLNGLCAVAPFLEQLDIHSDVLSTGMEPLLLAQQLRRLELFNCSIGPTGAIAVGKLLSQTACLVELGVANNDLGREGAASLGVGLSTCTSLRKLDVADNQLGNAGLVALGIKSSSVQHLDLDGNGITAIAPLDLGGANGKLRHLSVYGQAVPLVQFELAVNSTLEHLECGDFPVTSFMPLGLGRNSTLKRLDIYQVQFSNELADTLATELLAAAITELTLATCGLTDTQLGRLKLEENNKVRRLRLPNNPITDQGVRALRLHGNNTLRCLELQDCKVGREAAATVFLNAWQVVVLDEGHVRGGTLV